MDENRGLRHRLAKYEASPQQARYKYARQTGTVKRPPGSGGRDNRGSNNCGGDAAVMKRGGGGAFERRDDRHGHGKPVSCLNSRESAAFADRVLMF